MLSQVYSIWILYALYTFKRNYYVYLILVLNAAGKEEEDDAKQGGFLIVW